MPSTYLDNIIVKQHGSASAMVVFIDVVKYSKRKSVKQQDVILNFNNLIETAINAVSAKHVTEAQKQSINFATDLIKIPTGDGAAIVFPFIGINNIQLNFATEFLAAAVSSREQPCAIFDKEGWCNCHNYLDVRIGVSEGKSIIYKDVNGNYNIAGNTINTASRVMGLGDRQQILFTGEAYRALIDMTQDTSLEEKFKDHGEVSVKHELKIQVYQYAGGENYINQGIPDQIEMHIRRRKISTNNPAFNDSHQSIEQQKNSLDILELMSSIPLSGEAKEMLSSFTDPTKKDKAVKALLLMKSMNELLSGNKIIDN